MRRDLTAHDAAMAARRAIPYEPHRLTPPGVTCPCDFCDGRRRRNASAMWWLARGLRRLAGFDQGGN